MKIKYTHFAADPSLRNTITNLPAHVAQVLIAQGSAVQVKPATFKEFMDEHNPPAKPVPVEWGIKQAGAYTPALVVKRDVNGMTLFKTPPPDCPAAVVVQWKYLTDGAPEVVLGPEEGKVLEAAWRNRNGEGYLPVFLGKDAKGEPVYFKRG